MGTEKQLIKSRGKSTDHCKDRVQVIQGRVSDQLPKKLAPTGNCYELVQLQIKYMETVGTHNAVNPDFLQCSVLQRNTSNEIV